MATLWQTAFSSAFRRVWFVGNFHISYDISFQSASKVPNDNMSALAQMIAWHRTGDKPLAVPMMTLFTDAFMRHRPQWANDMLIAFACDTDMTVLTLMVPPEASFVGAFSANEFSRNIKDPRIAE